MNETGKQEAGSGEKERLQRFWGVTIFSLGALWGLVNIIYSPVAALTSVKGSSWFEGMIVVAGGLLTVCSSLAAFYLRVAASWLLVIGGCGLILGVLVEQHVSPGDTSGFTNLMLLYLAGGVPFALGVFGLLTEHLQWPHLR